MRKYKSFSIIAGIGILILINFYLSSRINGLVKTKKSLDAKLSSVAHQKQELDALANQYNQLHSNINNLSTLFPKNDEDFAYFSEELSSTASSSGIRLVQTFEELSAVKTDPDGKKKVPLTLEISGDYLKLVDFLTKINQLPYYFAIEQMSVLNDETGIKSTVKLSLYIHK